MRRTGRRRPVTSPHEAACPQMGDASSIPTPPQQIRGKAVAHVREVADDGVGGADPDNGSGLRGLADRIAVLEGRLEIDSERGRGTTIRARIPCA